MQVRPSTKSASGSRLKTASLPPPVKGWNARDPLTAMKPGYALRLDNWICRTDGLHLRPGQERWLTGINGAIQTLFAWVGQGREPVLFAASPSAIYDVTHGRSSNIATNLVTLPAVADPLPTVLSIDSPISIDTPIAIDTVQTPNLNGFTSGFWSSVLHSNPGTTNLLIANGSDGVWRFDGTYWTPCAITSAQAHRALDPKTLTNIIIHHRRVWFIEANSFRIWYLELDAVQGQAHCIDLSAVCRAGGSLVAMASQTKLGGRSAQDALICITSNGEMVVYDGSDPAHAQTWSLGAVYDVPSPVGQRCLLRYGGDLLYASQQGLLPVSGLIAKPDPERPLTALSDEIRKAWEAAARTGINSPMWSVVDSEYHRLTLINAPTYTGSVQLVKSAEGGWSAFVGLNATCWLELGDDLFFGRGDGTVWRLGGDRDDGQPIVAYCVEAYSKFGTGARKSFKRINPVYDTPARLRSRLELSVNYAALPAVKGSNSPYLSGDWTWDQMSWAMTPMPWTKDVRGQSNAWRGITGNGTSAALVHAVSGNSPVVYFGSEIMFELGGAL